MDLLSAIESLNQQVSNIKPVRVFGRVISIKGMIIESLGIADFVKIGTRCEIETSIHDSENVMCEVVGFNDKTVLLMPFSEVDGIGAGALVEVCDSDNMIMPDESWMGRVMNSFCKPIDDLGPLKHGFKSYPIKAPPPSSG
ncbi:MAG: hypothetical protein V4485_05115 [Pseudomonadota bacterium]